LQEIAPYRFAVLSRRIFASRVRTAQYASRCLRRIAARSIGFFALCFVPVGNWERSISIFTGHSLCLEVNLVNSVCQTVGWEANTIAAGRGDRAQKSAVGTMDKARPPTKISRPLSDERLLFRLALPRFPWPCGPRWAAASRPDPQCACGSSCAERTRLVPVRCCGGARP
jgi:hypothetical protein